MSHETIPAITTRIEHWAPSFLDSGHEIPEPGIGPPTFLSVIPYGMTPISATGLSALPAWRAAGAVV